MNRSSEQNNVILSMTFKVKFAAYSNERRIDLRTKSIQLTFIMIVDPWFANIKNIL